MSNPPRAGIIIKAIHFINTRSAIDHAVAIGTVCKRYVAELTDIWVWASIEGIEGRVASSAYSSG